MLRRKAPLLKEINACAIAKAWEFTMLGYGVGSLASKCYGH